MDTKNQDSEARNLLVYVNNPLEFEKLVNQYVKIHVKNKTSYEGFVKTIDPVSESVVLVNFENGKPARIQIVMGHAIDSVEVIKENSNHDNAESLKKLFMKETEVKTKEDLNEIKNKVKSWLLKNRFPISEKKEDGSLIVAGALKIVPPYDASSCYCENDIILGKIQGLLNTMPNDLDEWDNSSYPC